MTGSGLILIDKPGGITSHDVVARVRRAAGTRKVGHAGTLDPMATGLLVLGVNSSTRLLTFIVGAEKTYTATIRLGVSTITDDAEGAIVQRAERSALGAVDVEQVRAGVARLTGEILQVPSSVSAIKVEGKRAYARVRAGEEVELKPRPVTVKTFDITSVDTSSDYIDLGVTVECSSGTYIRALARDLGAGLGVGGHLTVLRRTRIGPFDVRQAHDLGTLRADDALISASDAATALFPALRLTSEQTSGLGNGQRVTVPGSDDLRGSDSPVAALAPDGRLVGLVRLHEGVATVLVNFPTDGSA